MMPELLGTELSRESSPVHQDPGELEEATRCLQNGGWRKKEMGEPSGFYHQTEAVSFACLSP